MPAGQPTAKAPAKAPAAAADKGWTLFGSLRVRVEDQNFFPTPKANGAYTYVAETLQFGIMRQTSQVDYLLDEGLRACLDRISFRNSVIDFHWKFKFRPLVLKPTDDTPHEEPAWLV